ncbi:VOC family protein [Paenibacillus agricola]|uniref:VOC family protein n=1 Tax=Paenibacillus agricola TaxID=2716264 RepID=A0ABX0JCI7_9BACL|nr:VOC family protein [Paenibacillus agricola]NHN33668.1 VOC family protein [Paenibacillus agricola]
MAVNVKNYAVVQLPVRDLEASVRWYKGGLGIPFRSNTPPASRGLAQRRGSRPRAHSLHGGAEVGEMAYKPQALPSATLTDI